MATDIFEIKFMTDINVVIKTEATVDLVQKQIWR